MSEGSCCMDRGGKGSSKGHGCIRAESHALAAACLQHDIHGFRVACVSAVASCSEQPAFTLPLQTWGLHAHKG